MKINLLFIGDPLLLNAARAAWKTMITKTPASAVKGRLLTTTADDQDSALAVNALVKWFPRETQPVTKIP